MGDRLRKIVLFVFVLSGDEFSRGELSRVGTGEISSPEFEWWVLVSFLRSCPLRDVGLSLCNRALPLARSLGLAHLSKPGGLICKRGW